MPMNNKKIAEHLNRLANLLEISDANPFRVRAYRNVARVIVGLSKSVQDLIHEGIDLTTLPGIGRDLADKITTLVKSGELPLLREIEAKLPSFLSELMTIEGLGAKRVQLIYRKLKINNLQELHIAIRQGKLKKIKGFGDKIEQKLLQSLTTRHQDYFSLSDIFPVVTQLLAYLKEIKIAQRVVATGSFRRCKDLVRDLDILVTTDQPKAMIEHFIRYPDIETVNAEGTTRASVRFRSGLQVDLRVVAEKSYGAALVYFTGSKEHNIAIRQIAVRKKLKLNEYGVYKGERYISGATEEEVYQSINLPFIEPELRENHGEIERARADQLPKLIQIKDLRGDLHTHDSLLAADHRKEIARSYAMAYEYLTIAYRASDVQSGQWDQTLHKIKKMNVEGPITYLLAIMVEINEDGLFNVPDRILQMFDVRIAYPNLAAKLSPKKLIRSMMLALDQRHSNILMLTHAFWAHYEGKIPLETIMHKAKINQCFLELAFEDIHPNLRDHMCQLAKEIGTKIALSSYARTASQLKNIEFSLFQARRGWLEKIDVINTLPLVKLKRLLQK